ncbi:hypothetical protein GCM10027184_21310 [Saccharothrix stipae]
MRIAIEARYPDARGRIVEINEQVRLRQANGQNLVDRVTKLVRLADARAAREKAKIAAFFVHEDFDAVDSPERAATRRRVQQALSARLDGAHYVLATWEIEAWLLLFPRAVSATHPSWTIPKKYRGRDTAKVHDPKQVMAREVSRSGGRRYRESDAPMILDKAVELEESTTPSGTNISWLELQTDIDSLASSIRS